MLGPVAPEVRDRFVRALLGVEQLCTRDLRDPEMLCMANRSSARPGQSPLAGEFRDTDISCYSVDMTRYEDSTGRGRGHRGRGRWPEESEFGARWGGPPFGGRRMRRGDIRPALLRTLLDGPAHGYEAIRRLEERTGGLWRPSPGSVYPTLQLLEEQGLLRSHEDAGKRIYELTDIGRAEAEAGPGPERGFPWDNEESLTGHRALRRAVAQLMLASKQVQVAGDPDLLERATAIVKEARQKLYQLLAES
jgi:DNA-binding PadR family transcriptional regulator